MEYQGFSIENSSPEQLAQFKDMYKSGLDRSHGKVRMKPRKRPAGEHEYEVAIQDGEKLWVTFRIKRSKDNDVYLFYPRADRESNPHTSYHKDGTFHSKSYGSKIGSSSKRQPPDSNFTGSEHIGSFGGHGGRTIGLEYDQLAWDGVIEVKPGVLGPRNGTVVVDLLAPLAVPLEWYAEVIVSHIFKDRVPWISVRVCRDIEFPDQPK